MDKKQREERRRQEDRDLNRGLLWVAGAVVFECLLFLINRYYINPYISEAQTAMAVMHVMTWVRIGGTVLGLAGVVWTLVRLRQEKPVALPVVLTAVFLVAALCSHVVLQFNKEGIQMLYLLIPAFAGLALVYYLYQREFFLAAVASGAATVGLWFKLYGGTVEMVLCVVIIAAVIGLTLMLQKNDGAFQMGGRTVQVLAPRDSCRMVLISCAVGVAALALGLVGNVAYYLVFAMAAWIFALLVYYTVKLM